ncbi:MAG: hypothetical protein HY272_12365 [Gammaproteobacteria bacterium]|nr:hypothetical protein [Gammaproteobacteria bacterium]
MRLFIAQLVDAQQENDQAISRVGELLEILATGTRESIKQNNQQQLNEIVNFLQAHDKLNQRLEHIRNGMEALAQQLNQCSTAKWTRLANQLPSSYTLEAEHRIYRQMFGIEKKESSTPIDPDDNIELF